MATQPDTTTAILAKVNAGYGINRVLGDKQLFAAIGFHIGSELLADKEFRLLDTHLRVQWPKLVEYLVEHGVYHWIAIHTKVESEHADAALEAATLALSFYTGDMNEARAWILEGFQAFADLQTEFMESLIPAS